MDCEICWEKLDSQPGYDIDAPIAPEKKAKLELESMRSEMPEITKLKCGHSFHKVCIKRWIKQLNANQKGRPKGSCPTCGGEVDVDQFYPPDIFTATSNSKGSTLHSTTGSQPVVPLAPSSPPPQEGTDGSPIHDTSCGSHRCDHLRQRLNYLEKENQELKQQLDKERTRADLNQAKFASLETAQPAVIVHEKENGTYHIKAPKSGQVTLKLEGPQGTTPSVGCINVNFVEKASEEEEEGEVEYEEEDEDEYEDESEEEDLSDDEFA